MAGGVGPCEASAARGYEPAARSTCARLKRPVVRQRRQLRLRHSGGVAAATAATTTATRFVGRLNMAALTGHAFLGGSLARSSTILSRTTNLLVVPVRGTKVKKPPQKPKKKATVESVMASIEAKGFLRSYKPYTATPDVSERLNSLLESQGLGTDDRTEIGGDLRLKFDLLSRCEAEFKHSVPNSRLVDIDTIGKLRKFYETSVKTSTPYDALQNLDLPPNLHIQAEYVRFHPDTDKLFDGKTAFPQSATLVTGLKYKGKFPGHRPEKPWPIRVKSLLDE